jgi:hypothetical protein
MEKKCLPAGREADLKVGYSSSSAWQSLTFMMNQA